VDREPLRRILQLKREPSVDRHQVRNSGEGRRRDQHLPAAGLALDPPDDVHVATDSCVLHAQAGADGADDGVTGVDGDPDGQLREPPRSVLAVQLGHAELQLDRRRHRVLGGGRIVEWGPEEDEETIAQDLVDGPPVRQDPLRRHLQVAVEHGDDLIGTELFGEAGESPDVGHQQGELATLPLEAEPVRRAEQTADDVVADVAAEDVTKVIVAPHQVGFPLLSPPTGTQFPNDAACLGDGRSQIVDVERLDLEVEGSAHHGGADVGHVAVGGEHDRLRRHRHRFQPRQQLETVHPRHVQVGDDHLDVGIGLDDVERIARARCAVQPDRLRSELASQPQLEQAADVRFVVHDEEPDRPAVLDSCHLALLGAAEPLGSATACTVVDCLSARRSPG
jgi:hypothetical protein